MKDATRSNIYLAIAAMIAATPLAVPASITASWLNGSVVNRPEPIA